MSCQHLKQVGIGYDVYWCSVCGAVRKGGGDWHEPEGRQRRQRTVYAWAAATFGAATMSPVERALRLVEEVVELAQAEGLAPELVRAVLDHVYAKPPGDRAQEVGGVGVTLLAYCEARGLSADAEEARELARVLAIDPERFRERHNIKAAAGIAAKATKE